VAFSRRDEGGLVITETAPGSAQRWRSALVVGLIGLVTTASSAWWVHVRDQEESAQELIEQGEALAASVDDVLDQVIERLISVGSFFQASDVVSQDDFRRFVANFGPIPGMGGIGYMPIVRSDELTNFEAMVRETIPDYYVFEIDGHSARIPVRERPFHVPVQWFEPGDAFDRPHGFDSTSEPSRHSALLRARTEKLPAVTTFLTLVSEDENDGFLVYWPVTDPVTSEVIGFTVAPMDRSELLERPAREAASYDLDWDIEVLSTGRVPRPVSSDAWYTTIDVGSNWWELAVTRAEGSAFPLERSEETLVAIVISGLATTLLAATVVYQLRRRKETQLELAQLIALTRAKDEFLASVSHELRTPLTGVLGFAELLRENQDDLSDEERRSMIANVAAEATDLSSIIDDLLVAARSELDLLAITRVPVSLRAQLSQVLEAADAEVGDRVEIVGAPRQPAIGDPGRVRQIIRNLITNAGRYGGDRIEVRFQEIHGVTVLEVADNGPGVPDPEQERIFEPYYRADQTVGTQPAALGIGLSVARHLSNLMDGDLTYQRVAGWSVFRLVLPASESEPAMTNTALETLSR